MKSSDRKPTLIEPDQITHQHLICWKSVFAGVLISMMSFMILSALGGGVLGMGAERAIEREKGALILATGAGLWLGLSVVISLFLGSYFALRISTHITNKVGAGHGFVVASIFFILMMMGMGSGIGALSRGFASIAEGIGSGSAALASNPQVQDTIGRALGTSNLKSDPQYVAQGLALRLLQGDVASAKSYFAYQTGISEADADAKIAKLQVEFDGAVKVAGENAARATADAGWSLFVTFLVGLIGALFGGRVGAHANRERPLSVHHEVPASTSGFSGVLAGQRGNVVPYIFGWLLGVPVSILLLIALLRTVF